MKQIIIPISRAKRKACAVSIAVACGLVLLLATRDESGGRILFDVVGLKPGVGLSFVFAGKGGRRGRRRKTNGPMGSSSSATGRARQLEGNEDREPRYLAFGTSITWGAGLEDRNDAYPHLLSPDAKNLAIRCTGPAYPSLCLQSMVDDDEVYDVIVLEYEYVKHGLVLLARRLRQRYPDATIIIISDWNPIMVQRNIDGGRESLHKWAEQFGERNKGKLHHEKFRSAFLETTHDWWWVTNLPWWEANTRAEEEAVREVGGYLLDLAKPENPRDIVNHVDLFAPDWHHLSKKGHEYVAEEVRKIVASAGIEANPRLGSWGHGDSCHSWFESGEDVLEHSENIEMRRFHDQHRKHALEVPRDGGTVTVDNPSDEPLELFLTYMVTGPAPGKYPETLVVVGDSPSGVVLDAVAPSSQIGHRVHVSVTKSVGMAEPGRNVITLQPLEEKEYPFRLISTTLTGENVEKGIGRGVVQGNFRGDMVVSRTSDERL